MQDRHLTDEELVPYFDQLGISRRKINDDARVKALILQQADPQKGYPRLIKNLEIYSNALFENVVVATIPIRVMLNVTRRKSLNSKTFESKTQLNVGCFLCKLDLGQRGILVLDGKYIVLTNPGITLPGDLTIAATEHKLQLLRPNLEDMITLSEILPTFSIYFNGPLAGASSPHFHFQGGFKDRLPGEQQINLLLAGKKVGDAHLKKILDTKEVSIYNIENYLRSAQIIVGKSKEALLDFLFHYLECLAEVDKAIKGIPNYPDFGSFIPSLNMEEQEPRFNLMVKYYPDYKAYLACFFPKRFNRPQIYFLPGKKRIVLGMAIKEALGNIITGRRLDYNRLLKNPDLIKQAYADTSITHEMEKELLNKFSAI